MIGTMMVLYGQFYRFIRLCKDTYISGFYICRDKPRVICFEGNIGASKTTVIQNLSKLIGEHKAVMLQEPVSLWRNLNGHNMLELFYNDPHSFGFILQTFVQTSLLHEYRKTIQQCDPGTIILMERSMSSSKEFFIPTMRRNGYINEYQEMISSYLCDVFSELFPVDAVIYLQSDPKQCLTRITNRGREEEVGRVSLEYLNQLHVLHEDWYKRKGSFIVNIECLSRDEAATSTYVLLKENNLL
jgi:deoxynucleoside kinase